MRSKNYTDEELMLLMKEGSENAFEILYKSYALDLIDFAAARLKSLEEARDIIHDLFVLLWQQRQEIDVSVSLKAYLFASVKYRIIDHIRKADVQKKYAETVLLLPSTVTIEQKMDEKDLHRFLQKAISDLSPRLKEVFMLSRYQHLNTSEIARKLGTSEQTVKNQLTSALSQIRSKLSATIILLVLLKLFLFPE